MVGLLGPSTSCPRIWTHPPRVPTPSLGYSRPQSQLCQEPVQPTSRWTLDPGISEHNSTCRWASSSSRAPRFSAANCLMTQAQPQEPAASTQGRAWQSTRLGTSQVYQTSHHKRRTHAAHHGYPWARGECTAGTHRTSPTRGHLFKVSKHNQLMKYTKLKT